MKKFMILASTLLLSSGFASLAIAQQTTPYSAGSHMMWRDGWYGWFFGPFMMIAFLAIAVAVVVIIVRAFSGPASPTPTQSGQTSRDPLEILKTRYARGDIDKEEYEERRKVLED